MSWVSGGFAAGLVNQWGGKVILTVDISAATLPPIPEDILYLIGTDLGASPWSNPLDGVRCAVSASSIQGQPPSNLGNRTTDYFATNNVPGDWVAFDFDPEEKGTRVNLDAFAWQHVNTLSSFRLRYFVVEAGEGSSVATATWTTVATISDTSFVTGTSDWSTVRPLTELENPYRFIRIRLTGTDSNGTHFLLGSEVVFGGQMFPRSTINWSSAPETPDPPATSDITVDISGADPATAIPQDIFYSFGSDFGGSPWSNPLDGARIAVSASSINNPTFRPPENLGDRSNSNFSTDDAAGSSVAFDFDPSGNGTRVNLDAFAWQHISTNKNRLRHFVIEAGDGSSVGSATWTTIATIANISFLPSQAHAWSAVQALTSLAQPYRFVRVRSTGIDSSGDHELNGSEVIFGGVITPGA
ncbi:MAG: hypothetical protein AAGF75_06415 [Cyanobacteria bacterium P01_H01_bin.130]